MRTGKFQFRSRLRLAIALLVTSGLLLAPLSMATSHKEARDGDGGGRGADKGARQEARQERASQAEAAREEFKAARQAAFEAFKERRAAALETYHARLKEIRETYLDAKRAVLAACREKTRDSAPGAGYAYAPDAAEESRAAFAHCVRDGLKPLKEEARAGMREAHADVKASLKRATQEIVKEFREKQREVRERHARGGA